jgi:hypothetical protein
MSSDAKPMQLTQLIVRLAIDIAKIYISQILGQQSYNHTDYEQYQNYSIQILNIKYNHSSSLFY